jgi:hypothetical protein
LFQHNFLPKSGANANTPQAQDEHFVAAEVAAEFLACSRKHLLRLSLLGKIPAHPLPGSGQRRTWRYLLSELRMWMLRDGIPPNDRSNHDDGRTILSGSPRKKGGR